MNGNIFARLTGTKRNLLALLASSAMLTAGCANMTPAASNVDAFAQNANLGGRVHGGNQPVSGATVNLYFAGQGSILPVLASTTTTDNTGSFSFVENSTSANNGTDNTFSCPTNEGTPLVYVVAKGGNTLNNGDSSVNNSAAAFIAMYGTCAQLKAATGFVDMTEVTTVATLAALQQFFTPSNYWITADGVGQQYNVMLNIPNTIALMANVANGTAVSSTVIPPFTGSGSNGVTGVNVTATPETSKLNTIADILASCVNSASAAATPCTTLFANAVPPSPSVTNAPAGTVFAPATDVVQAAYYMLTNPTNGSNTNLSNLYALAGGAASPYQPSLTSQPSDWTLAISYSSTSDCASSSGSFISQPYDINIDAADNVWIANSQATNGNLAELSAKGAASTCVFLAGGSHGGATVDSSGNIWLATTSSSNVYRYSTGINPNLPQGILAFPTAAPALGVTADGLGNVYFTSTTGTSGTLYQIPGAATATAAVAPTSISTLVGPNPIRLMPDYHGDTTPSDIWVTSGAGYVSRVAPAVSGAPNFENGFSTSTFEIGTAAYGIAVTATNNVFVSSGGSDNFITYLTGSGTSYTPAWTTSAGFAGLNTPTAISIDGRNNVWAPNNTNSSITVSGVTQTVGSVSEISAAANALSSAPTGFQKGSSFLASGRASVVDQAGNVWIVGDGTVGNPSNYITEIVGAGVPIYQPYALGLTNGRFQTVP